MSRSVIIATITFDGKLGQRLVKVEWAPDGAPMTTRNALDRGDKHLAFFLGLVCGLPIFIALFLLVQLLTFGSEEKLRLGALLLGAFLSGLVAVGLHFATNRRKDRDNADELEQIKRAIWQDLRATLQMIFTDYEYWNDAELLGEEDLANFEVEHLRPTVFDAVIAEIGRLDEEQSFYLLLVHDNLRSSREAIKAFSYKPSEVRAAHGQTVAEAKENYRNKMSEDAKEIASVLERVCYDAVNALKMLDPTGEYEKRFHSMRKRPGADTSWRKRLDALIQRIDAEAATYRF